ncbi:MAG TPA: DegT/DnrJ/EryC1/StrS family aminotransferase [bacterium]|nr:DegT/DnrJ/EryC1/StrS family aminotransferase [bacterium]
MTIPMVDLTKQYQALQKEINRTIGRVLQSTQFIMGSEVEAFEKEMAEYCQTRFAVSCNSGTDALQICLMAIDIQPGDEVITTPFTFVATAEVIRLLKARPVYVDIDPDTYLLDISRIERKITKRTRAILPVHLFGQCADMDPINELADRHGLVVIEDACQAVGATYRGRKACSLGSMGCLSFFPSKNLGAYGDGGMVLTSDEQLAEKIRMIRNHGSSRRYYHEVIGVNSRLDTLQAAVLRVKLKHLDMWNEARKDRAALYTELLSRGNVVTPVILEDRSHVFHQYSIRVKDRDGLRKALDEHGITTAVYYPVPLHCQPAFADGRQKEGLFPMTEKTAQNILSLPMYPELKEKDVQAIACQVLSFTG